MFFGSFHPRRFVRAFGSALLLLMATGCVSIYDDKIRVQRPEEMDPNQRNVLDKCTPHTLPHRLITGHMGLGVTILNGSPIAYDQPTFDIYWGSFSPDLTGGATSDELKPNINWEVQVARFLPVHIGNRCEKVKAYGMETDCYQISYIFYKYVEGTNCTASTSHPVFVYIYPKSTLPAAPKWLSGPYSTPTPVP
jgi:hypothetical protein